MWAECHVITVVDADLDIVDGTGAAPGVAADHVFAGVEDLGVVVGAGDDGLHADGGDELLVGRIGGVGIVVELVVVPALGHFLSHFKAAEPLDRPVAGPAGHQ